MHDGRHRYLFNAYRLYETFFQGERVYTFPATQKWPQANYLAGLECHNGRGKTMTRLGKAI